MTTAAAIDLRELEKDPRLFLYTSLTAGSSHIITATSRLETILKANKIPFQAIDLATDEKARRLWQRRAGSRKLPGLVKEGYVLGDLAEVEEWNEFGELKENIGPVPASNAAPAGGLVGVNIRPPSQFAPPANTTGATRPANAPSTVSTTGVSGQTAVPAAKMPEAGFDKTKGIALPLAAEVAARAQAMKKPQEESSPATTAALPAETKSIDTNEAQTQVPRRTSISFAPNTAPPKSAVGATPVNTAVAAEKSIESSETSHPSAASGLSTNSAATADTSGPEEITETSTAKVSAAVPKAAETTAIPSSVKGSDALAPPKITHQGKEVRSASEEEIREVEHANTIKEVDQEDDEAGVGSTTAQVKGLNVADKPASQTTDEAESAETGTSAETESTVPITQQQDPKEAADATKSVED